MTIKATFTGSNPYVYGYGLILVLGKEYILEVTEAGKPGEIKAILKGIELPGKDTPVVLYTSFMAFLKNWNSIKKYQL